MVKKLAAVAMPALVAVVLGLATPAHAQAGATTFPCPTAVTPGAFAIACPTFAYAITPGAAAFTPPPTAIAGPVIAPFGTFGTNTNNVSTAPSLGSRFGGLRIGNDGGPARSFAPLAAIALGLFAVYVTLMRLVRTRVAATATA